MREQSVEYYVVRWPDGNEQRCKTFVDVENALYDRETTSPIDAMTARITSHWLPRRSGTVIESRVSPMWFVDAESWRTWVRAALREGVRIINSGEYPVARKVRRKLEPA